jgi:uncharacterized protein (DUF305 family)
MMSKQVGLWTALLALIVVAGLVLAGCTPVTAPAQAPAAGEDTSTPDAAAQETEDDSQAMAGHDMDHGAMHAAGQPYDVAFIDGMIPHHEGAIVMAQQALEQSERDELKQMAQAIIDTQAAEIEQLRAWRTAWYPDAAASDEMHMEGMGPMEVPTGDEAFDLRFIDSMIPHHESAIVMAQQAMEEAEREEVKQLAQAIIDTQAAEIAQLLEWRKAWFPDAD